MRSIKIRKTVVLAAHRHETQKRKVGTNLIHLSTKKKTDIMQLGQFGKRLRLSFMIYSQSNITPFFEKAEISDWEIVIKCNSN